MPPVTDEVRWRKAGRSGGTDGNCVELANTGLIRDSKDPDGGSLPGAATVLTAVKAGWLDR